MSEAALDNAMNMLNEKIDIAGQPTEWFEMTQDRK